MSEAKVEYRHHDKATELVSRIAHPIDSRGAEAARQYNRTLLAQALADAESAQPAERAGEWVSVEERLPPTGCNVIVDGGCAFFDGQVWRSSMASGAMRKIEWEVTHWMPLPPPPQPKEKP